MHSTCSLLHESPLPHDEHVLSWLKEFVKCLSTPLGDRSFKKVGTKLVPAS
uniref:Uncharacterized protein n=1 Tax=Picea sitchensis TaxID=3332 RepID=A0A6B9XV27_PICSI|nr:hypothetical protein Q903MT_gene4138 [Picea sitchensis]